MTEDVVSSQWKFAYQQSLSLYFMNDVKIKSRFDRPARRQAAQSTVAHWIILSDQTQRNSKELKGYGFKQTK